MITTGIDPLCGPTITIDARNPLASDLTRMLAFFASGQTGNAYACYQRMAGIVVNTREADHHLGNALVQHSKQMDKWAVDNRKTVPSINRDGIGGTDGGKAQG